MTSRTGFHLLVLLGIAMLAWLPSPLTAADRPNLLLIVADDLGFSDLGCYGGEIETPHLDQLAADGVRFTQLYNTGRCCPSRASILTGQYPHRVGLGHMTTDLGQPGYQGRLAPQVGTVAEMLSAAGYRTFLSGKWHLGTDDPTQHGFDEFYGTLVSAKTFWDPDHFLRKPADRARPKYDPEEFYGTDALGDQALQFLQDAPAAPDRPWFLYLAFNAPHFPLQARPEEIQKYADRYHVGWDEIRRLRYERLQKLGLIDEATQLSPRSLYWDWGEATPLENPAWESLPADRRGDLARRMAIYAAMVDRLDQNVGRIVEHLRQNEQLDNTLILFLSDNGACAEWDPFGFDIRSSRNNTLHWDDQLAKMGGPGTFHSVGSGWANASNTPFRLYKHYNHEGGIATPAILHWPERFRDEPFGEKGSLCTTPAHIIDIVPTLLEAAGSETIPHQSERQQDERTPLPLPGQSLLATLKAPSSQPRTLFFEHQGNRAVREGAWKLAAVRGQPWELYNITQDRSEMHDLAARQPQRVRQLAQKWQTWAKANQVLPIPKNYGVQYLAPPDEE